MGDTTVPGLRVTRRSARLHVMRTRAAPKHVVVLAALVVAAGCGAPNDGPTTPPVDSTTACAPATVTLGVAEAERVDCSNGGVRVQLAGNGASYLVVAQFPTSQAPIGLVAYSLSADATASALASRVRAPATALHRQAGLPAVARGFVWNRQDAGDVVLRARGRALAAGSAFAFFRRRASGPAVAAAVAPPPLGSIRAFHVLSNFNADAPAWQRVGAQLDYIGNNVLVYVDTLAPAGGFGPAELQQLGAYFDQDLYPVDTVAFGQPSDVDDNGRVIMLLSPVVNGDTPAGACGAEGYIAGFFDPEDFEGPADSASNQGEIFYSIVPDPAGRFSCPHSAGSVSAVIPATFLHELQHLINFSQHVIVSGGFPASSWLDEGMSIVAEELGSVQYEARCPPPMCRTNPQQLFPDSSELFTASFPSDSYDFALDPDTASLTLHTDDELGFSWRGGDWALARWLGDQMGAGFYRKLEHGPSDGIADIEAATGQGFASLFANFGLALFTDSLPGFPRATAPAADRFVSRNLRQLWTGWSLTPLPFPIVPAPVTTDTALAAMQPGAMAYYRLDTPAGASTVTLRFAAPGGKPLLPALEPQLSIFRLPPPL
jgi:hypothetical protein